MSRPRDQDGVVVVLAVGLAALLVLIAVVCSGAVALVAAHRKVQAAADLAALAGAEAVRTGREGCAGAGRIAAENGAVLRDCHVAGSVVEVVVRLELDLVGSRVLTARARAGQVG
jgi:secretion/DNA translocation related TadE-like protein